MSNAGKVVFNAKVPTSKQGELDLPSSLLLPRGSGLAAHSDKVAQRGLPAI